MQQNNFDYNNPNQGYYNPYGGYSNYGYDPNNPFNLDEKTQQEALKRQKVLKQQKQIRKISFSMGCAIIGYLIMQFVVIIPILMIPGMRELYNDSATFQNAFNIVGVSILCVLVPFFIMALINKKGYESPIIPNKPIKAWECIKWVGFAMLCCVVTNFVLGYVISFFQNLFGIDLSQNDPASPQNIFDCVLLVFSTAIVPAVCEELAMRCCSLQLLKKYGKGFAVTAVSIVFGLLHGNVSQFIFAFVVGMILGYVTIKTDSIVPAMLTHGLSNGIYVVSEIVQFSAGEDLADSATVTLYGFWFFFGIACLSLLAKSGQLRKAPKPYDEDDVLTNGQKFSAFLFPWMIVPFLLLIIMTISSIKQA